MLKSKLVLDSSEVVAALTRANSTEVKNNPKPEQQSSDVREVMAAGLTEYNAAPSGDLGCGGGGGCIAVAAK